MMKKILNGYVKFMMMAFGFCVVGILVWNFLTGKEATEYIFSDGKIDGIYAWTEDSKYVLQFRSNVMVAYHDGNVIAVKKFIQHPKIKDALVMMDIVGIDVEKKATEPLVHYIYQNLDKKSITIELKNGKSVKYDKIASGQLQTDAGILF